MYENFEININDIKTKDDVKNNFCNILTNMFPNIKMDKINILLKRYKTNNDYLNICKNLKNNNKITGIDFINSFIDYIGLYWWLNIPLLINNKLIELSYNYFYNTVLLRIDINKFTPTHYRINDTDTITVFYNSLNQTKPLKYKNIINQEGLKNEECLTTLCYSVMNLNNPQYDKMHNPKFLNLIELIITKFLMKLNNTKLDDINKEIDNQLNKIKKELPNFNYLSNI